jgi:hypothetical protein
MNQGDQLVIIVILAALTVMWGKEALVSHERGDSIGTVIDTALMCVFGVLTLIRAIAYLNVAL